MKNNIFLLAILCLATSCLQEIPFKEVVINNQYRVSIPEYLTPTAQLNDKALFQYQNEEKDMYMLIIHESREDLVNYEMDNSLEGYFKNLTSQGLIEKIKNGKISKEEHKTINGNKAMACRIQGIIGNSPVIYMLTVIESKDYFYQMLIWTREDTIEKSEQDIEKITRSFMVILQKS